MGKDHAGGKKLYNWEKIMLVGKDHVGGKRSCWLWNMVAEFRFLYRKTRFLHRMDPRVSVRNLNRSKLYVRSPPTRFQKSFGAKQAPCRDQTENLILNFQWGVPYFRPSTVVVAAGPAGRDREREREREEERVRESSHSAAPAVSASSEAGA